MLNTIKAALIFGGMALATAPVGAAVLNDFDDTAWTATAATVDFEVLSAGGGLNAINDIDIGIYSIANPSTRTVLFSSGISVGQTASVSAANLSSTLGGVFGFFISNVGTIFNGPYTYFSDSSLNPMTDGAATSGLDAMLFDDLGGGMFNVDIEDLFLPISNNIDFRLKVSGLNPSAISAVPLPASFAFLFFSLGGLAMVGRRSRT